MNTPTIIFLTVLTALLPFFVYVTVKMARAGWIRGEQAAKNHNHTNQEGERSNGVIDTRQEKKRGA